VKLFDEKAESRPLREERASKSSTRRERDRPTRSRVNSTDSAASAGSGTGSQRGVKAAGGDLSKHSPRRTPPPSPNGFHANDAPLPVPNPVPVPIPVFDCGLCSLNDFNLRDQLVPCTACGQSYHTKCFGSKRIPFSIKSIKERTNRDRYIAKHFSDWVCPVCADTKRGADSHPSIDTTAPPHESGDRFPSSFTNSSYGHSSGLEFGADTTALAGSPSSGTADKGTKSAASKLFGGFLGFARSYSKGTTPSSHDADLTNVGDDTVNPLFVPSGKVGYKQAGSPMPSKSGKTLSTSQEMGSPTDQSAGVGGAETPRQEDFEKLLGLLNACGVSLEELLSMSEEKQKETFLRVADRAKVAGEVNSPSAGSGEAQTAFNSGPSSPAPVAGQPLLASSSPNPSSPRSGQITLSAELFQKLARVDQKFAKYAKMFQVCPLPVSLPVSLSVSLTVHDSHL
jgi:hypothetical protein